jgi:hypothetical protein
MSIIKSRKTLAIVATMIVVVAVGGVTTNSIGLAFAQGQKFMAKLSGQDEVPPTNSQATGMAEFTPMGTDSVMYSVNATKIEGVTAGHIHLGKQGENGPVVVTLFKYDSPMNQVSESGSFTADKLEGPWAGKQISDATTAMTNGETYVNIHTEKNPMGEIRGQITGSGGK